MRPSSLGGGRILRRTLSVRPSVCLSVCLSVRPVSGSGCTLFTVAPSYERTSKIEKLRFSLMGQRHVCTFRHAQRAAYRTAISAAQILVKIATAVLRVGLRLKLKIFKLFVACSKPVILTGLVSALHAVWAGTSRSSHAAVSAVFSAMNGIGLRPIPFIAVMNHTRRTQTLRRVSSRLRETQFDYAYFISDDKIRTLRRTI